MTVASFRNERFDILNLLRTVIFGNAPITEFDPTATYNRNDLVYTYNEANHTVNVYKCIVETTSGEINDTEWSSSFAGSFADAIALSETEPINPDTQLWYKPIGESTHDIP